MPDGLDQINVTTRRFIQTSPQLVDDIYNQDPLNYFMRENLNESFTGGSTINEDFLYDTLPGGSYAKGKKFNVQQKQTEQQLRWEVKFMQVSVTLYQEDILVLNKGSLAAIKLLKARVSQAYMSLGAYTSVAQYLNGQNAGYVTNPNGLAEIINDGTNQSWDGNTYAAYGSLTRATYGNSISSTPNNLAGAAIEYDTIDQGYMDVNYGSGDYEPNLMMTTPRGFSYIKSRFQTQQRFQETKLEVGVGFRGLVFNGATVLSSRFVPGSQVITAGTDANRVAVNYLNETSSQSVTAYPVGNLSPSGKNAESLWILNARQPWLRYYVSDDALFGGGFRDFIPEGNSTNLVGQVLLAHNFTGHPRYHKCIYGFTG